MKDFLWDVFKYKEVPSKTQENGPYYHFILDFV